MAGMRSKRTGVEDFYRILGVLPTASRDDITAAYYGLARKHHPDAGATDPAALSQLKQINEAYEVLSDEQRRRDYDRRSEPGIGRQSRPTAANSFHGSVPIHRSAFRRPQKSADTMVAGPLDVEVELPVRPEEARDGGPCDMVLTIRHACDRCRGHGRVAGAACDGCEGQGQVRRRRHLQLHLPGGLRTGSILRIAGQGRHHAAAAGDLLVRIKVLPYW
jgi:DnaJ-class molecular chaperone